MPSSKELKRVFVIMPFTKTPTRNQSQLTAFFEDQIRTPIERGQFKHKYQVRRSDDTFNITEQIVKDLFLADIVICDLSGKESNPNVMYELGLRLAFSDEPVILIREGHKDNNSIFDISGFYAHPYDPLNYKALARHLKSKLRKLEAEPGQYRSPVLQIVKQDIPLIQQLSAHRADHFLDVMRSSITQIVRLFADALYNYVSKSGKTLGNRDQISSLEDLLTGIEQQKDVITKVDWSDFHWAIGAQPTIDYYLSNQYLYGLLDPIIERSFTAFLMVYHAHFISTTYYQGEWSAVAIHRFVGETSILTVVAQYLRLLLQTDNKDATKDVALEITGLLKKSQIMPHPSINGGEK